MYLSFGRSTSASENWASSLAELPNTYLTPQAISCSAKQAPPLPWNGFTAAPAALAAAAGTVAAAAGAVAATGAAGAVCATLTDETEPSTDWAAVAVSPALVRPRTKPR